MELMKTHKIAVAVAAASLIVLSAAAPANAAAPASAANAGIWAQWTGEDDAPASSFAFTGTDYAGTVAMTKIDNSNLYDTNGVYAVGEGVYFTAASPVGQVFGANGPSGSNAYSDRVGGAVTLAPTSVPGDGSGGLPEAAPASAPEASTSLFAGEPGGVSTTVFTFTTPIPAGSLGLAIQDFEKDNAEITATDVDGNVVSGVNLVGTATNTGFNECNFAPQPTDCTDGAGPYTGYPTVTANASSVTVAHPAGFVNVGSDIWIRPSASIKTLTIVHTSDNADGDSGIDISLAMLPAAVAAPAAPVLASTGLDALPLTIVGSILALLGVSVIATRVIVRRRQSNG